MIGNELTPWEADHEPDEYRGEFLIQRIGHNSAFYMGRYWEMRAKSFGLEVSVEYEPKWPKFHQLSQHVRISVRGERIEEFRAYMKLYDNKVEEGERFYPCLEKGCKRYVEWTITPEPAGMSIAITVGTMLCMTCSRFKAVDNYEAEEEPRGRD